MTEKQSKVMGAIMSFVLIFAMLLVAKESAELVKVWNQQNEQEKVMTVVIDAGHGGVGDSAENGSVKREFAVDIHVFFPSHIGLGDYCQ